MLSFEQKKLIFESFTGLEERHISYGRVNYIYSKSLKRGKVLATQLNESGNGYIIGKYLENELIKKKGYLVDNQGWISIKNFSKQELIELIHLALNYMSSTEQTSNPKKMI